MSNWAKWSKELQNLLHLRSNIIAFRKFDQAKDLEDIENITRIKNRLFSFCQVPYMSRVGRLTVGITRHDSMLDRCMRIFGLKTPSDKSMTSEAKTMATTWFASAEEGLKQQGDYPRIPASYEGAIIVGPLDEEKFDPEVIIIYGNPAQIMMLMCGLQKEKYERFDFSFIGEGTCSNSLAQCYVNKKPAVAIPCYGERAFGQIADDELVIALPPTEIERAISGIKKLIKTGLSYPINSIGGEADIFPFLSKLYPKAVNNLRTDAMKQ